MLFKTSIDRALDALRNTSLKSKLRQGLSPEAVAAINPALAALKFPPLPDDYLYFLSRTDGCDGPDFYLYGMEHIDIETGTINGCIVEEAEDYNRDEPEDDIEDKGYVLGHMYGRMMLVYQFERYIVMDTDCRLPLSDTYADIGAFIQESLESAERKTQKK